MITVRLRYVCQDVDRHGNARTYFWRKGHRKVRIREMLGTSALLEVYQKLLAESEAATLTSVRSPTKPQPGTYRWLCVEYFKSSRFCRLDPRTQRVRRRVLELTCEEPLFEGEAGLPNCSAHGLRKAGATIAAENGATEHQLLSIFGRATSKEAERYTKATKKKTAGDAMQLLRRSKGEQKVPTFGNNGGR
jgi:hypothetical protein